MQFDLLTYTEIDTLILIHYWYFSVSGACLHSLVFWFFLVASFVVFLFFKSTFFGGIWPFMLEIFRSVVHLLSLFFFGF
jgi:hypothetical protein